MAGRIAARNISTVLCSRTRHFLSPSFMPFESSLGCLPVDPTFTAYASKFYIIATSRLPVLMRIGDRRSFSADVSQLPVITDPDIFWDELPDAVVHDAKKDALANVFRAAEAVEQFGGVLVSLRMELDDETGITSKAMHAAYKRYVAYLDSFGPDETYLRKKVETELGTKMMHLKMRCGGLDSEWGTITVLGTSGLSGSYIEQRA
ncbi:hypothetical protein AMTRI_Chr07g24890 [Amborella trichopoda]